MPSSLGLITFLGERGMPSDKNFHFLCEKKFTYMKNKYLPKTVSKKNIFCELVTFEEWWNMTFSKVEIVTSNWDTWRSGNESPGIYTSRNLTFLEKPNITFKTTCPQDWYDHLSHGYKNGCFPFNYLFERDPYGLLQSQHTFVVYIPYKR